MAAGDNFIDGTETLLLIDDTTPLTTALADVVLPGNFEPIGCLTSNSWETSTATIDTTSKCSGLFNTSLPGDKSATASGEGNAITDADAVTLGVKNHNYLAKLAKDGTTVWLAFFDTAQETVRFGKAFITSFSDTAPRAAAQTFSVSWQIVGEWATEYPTT